MSFSPSTGCGQGLPTLDQFINWYPVPLANGKTDKTPCDTFGNNKSIHDQTNWRSQLVARQSAQRLAFVFTPHDDYVFIDVDHAYSMVTGKWSQLAKDVLATFPDAYTEVSQSGTGLHLVFRGARALPADHRIKLTGQPLEVYTSNRFIAITEHMARGSAEVDYADRMVAFMQRYGIPLERPKMRLDEGRDPAWLGPENDDELIALALAQTPTMRQGLGSTPTFRELWEMDIAALARKKPASGRADELPFEYNAVDASLMTHLSYFTGRDMPRMVRLFERWKGYRPEKYEGKGVYRLERVVGVGAGNPNVMQRGPGERALVAPPSVNGANFLELLNGSQLNDMLLPERQYIVEEFLPAGCILLVGKPKKGKSWMSLELACAVAAGGEFLGHQCVQGQVIYFALEDNLRRIQSRMRMVCNAKGYDIRVVMRNVRFAAIEMNVPTVDQGFNEMLLNTLDADPSITLAIVDTLNVIRPSKGKNEDPVMYDRRCVEPYTKALASRPGRCVLLVHHARKMASDDVADGASGTLGITAAADGSMFITVGPEGKTELHGQGRDMERFELVVELKAPLWHVIGDADGIAGMSGIRAKILQCVAKYALGVGPKEIATEIQEPYANVRVRLGPMVKAGLVQKDGYGKYITTPQGASLGFVPVAN